MYCGLHHNGQQLHEITERSQTGKRLVRNTANVQALDSVSAGNTTDVETLALTSN